MVLGFFGYLLSFRRKVYLLRKKYDRVREKADREKNPSKRQEALQILDQAEPTLRMLEEQRISRFDRGRLLNNAKTQIQQAKFVLGKDYYPQQYPYARRPVRA